MVDFCGQEATLIRWVTSSCINSGEGVQFGSLKDSVLLDVNRCDGRAYGGCQMQCPLIWQTDWLTTDLNSSVVESADDVQKLRQIAEANAIVGDRSCCQATKLLQIATPLNGSRIKQYKRELDLNRVSVTNILTSICSGALARLRGTSDGLQGHLTRTPVVDLDLQPGEKVRVKPRSGIVETLDKHGMNRGLWFDPIMLRYSGRVLKVTRRITKLVNEYDGRIMVLKVPAVVLDDLRCDRTARRFCTRLLNLFWREIWLERVA